MMKSRIFIISAVRDRTMYEKCIAENPNTAECNLVYFDNAVENIPVPVHYNSFLDAFDFTCPAWFVFCHEDFEAQEPLKKVLAEFATDSLWGPIGAYKKPVIPFLLHRWSMAGQIRETSKSGDATRLAGVVNPVFGVEVDTFDCCCLIAHSSIVQKFNLRFDVSLPWDLYVEDFCMQARKKGVKSRIAVFRSVHHSMHNELPSSYGSALAYLKQKYPADCYAGTSSWIGGNWLKQHIAIK